MNEYFAPETTTIHHVDEPATDATHTTTIHHVVTHKDGDSEGGWVGFTFAWIYAIIHVAGSLIAVYFALKCVKCKFDALQLLGAIVFGPFYVAYKLLTDYKACMA